MKELFTIYQLDVAEAERIAVSVNEPHLHDYEELIVGITGQLEHFIDFKSQVFDAPFVSFVTKGKVHRVRPLLVNGQIIMWVIRFHSEFIPETIFQLYSYYHDHANVSLNNDNCFSRLVALCEMMHGEYRQAEPDFAVLRQLLSTLFTMIESERRKSDTGNEDLKKTQSLTFKNFLALLEQHYHKPEGVNFYAEKLFMSSRNLNIICQRMLQQSVSEIIETRKLIEAKNLLITTDKTAAEIGFELGFRENSYFTHAFKKRSGQTPGEFRAEMRKLIS